MVPRGYGAAVRPFFQGRSLSESTLNTGSQGEAVTESCQRIRVEYAS
jgi:hypothetical protein